MIRPFHLKHLFFVGFIIAYLGFCLLTYKHYGITDDEYVERGAADDLLSYISQPTSTESITSDDYTDTVFEAGGHNPLISKYQRSYQLFQTFINTSDYYEWDHLINMVVASLFFITVYIIFYVSYKSVLKALIGVVFIALMPRLIGDIPTNNKDVPFALMYLLSLSAIFLTNKFSINNYIKIIVLGFIFGITQTFRVIGFSIYIVYIIFFLVTAFQSKSITKHNIVNFVLETFVIGLVSTLVSIIFFPWLGANLIMNMKELLFYSQNFQPWDNHILFNGEFLTKDQRPWHYLFTWIFITTPIFVLALVVTGLIRFKRYAKDSLALLVAISIIVNLTLYLIIQPVIYNGLRHFLFILPPLAILAAITFKDLISTLKKTYRYALLLLVALNSSVVIYNYVMLHPYEYIYFNELIGGLKGASNKYETDYWGATYKEAAEWLANKDGISENDYILTCDQYISVNYYSQYKFSMLSGDAKPTYSICSSDKALENKIIDNKDTIGEPVFEIKRMGATLNTIRKLPAN